MSMKFLGNMKTKLIQKYSKQIKQRKEWADLSDIRDPLKRFLDGQVSEKIGKPGFDSLNVSKDWSDLPANSNSYYQQKLKTLSTIGVTVNFTEFVEVVLKICSGVEKDAEERFKRIKEELVQTRRMATRFQNQLNSHIHRINTVPKLLVQVLDKMIKRNELNSIKDVDQISVGNYLSNEAGKHFGNNNIN
jgi:hypothetical protein